MYPYSGNTNYSLSVSATSTISDWFSQNLLDQQLVTLTRSLASDGNLSRNDMISIFRDAEDGGVIDANELTDLRTLVSNASRFTMQDYVAGYGVVNGHAYTVSSYNPSDGTFALRNPWGTQHANVTWNQLLSLQAIFAWSNT